MDTLRWKGGAGQAGRRIARRLTLQCDPLEGRALLSMFGAGVGGHAAYAHVRGGHEFGRVHRMGHMSTLSSAFGTTTAGGQTSTTPAPMTTTTADQTLTPAPTTTPTAITPATTTTTTTTSDASPPAPGSPPGNAANPGGPMVPASNPQLTTDLQKLQTETHAILAKSQVTVAQMVALQDDLQSIAKAETSAPSQATVQAFQTDLQGISGTLPTDAQKTQLETDYKAMLQSAGVTDSTLIDKAISDSEAIVTASGITSDDLANLAADRKAIQTDLTSANPNGPSAGLPGAGAGQLLDGLTGGGLLDGGMMGGGMVGGGTMGRGLVGAGASFGGGMVGGPAFGGGFSGPMGQSFVVSAGNGGVAIDSGGGFAGPGGGKFFLTSMNPGSSAGPVTATTTATASAGATGSGAVPLGGFGGPMGPMWL